MNSPSDSQENKRSLFDSAAASEAMRHAGMRVTPGRMKLMEVLAAKPGQYLSARELGEVLQSDGMLLPRASIYNTLTALESTGLVKQRHLPGRRGSEWSFIAPSARGRYAFEGAMKCRICGRVKVLRDSQVKSYFRNHRFQGFDMESAAVNVEITSICNRCKKLLET